MVPAVPEATWTGIDNLFDAYLGIGRLDHFAVIYSPECREVAAWVVVAARRRSIEPTVIGMAAIEDAGLRERLARQLPRAGELSGRLMVLTIERDSMSHFAVFRDLRRSYGPARCHVTRIISGSSDLFAQALALQPATLSGYNATLLHRLGAARTIRITTARGTDLAVEFDHERYEWTSNRGMNANGGFLILPPGEVATYPARVNGTLVADAAFNVNVHTRLDARLEDHPVTVDVVDSVGTRFSCADADVTRLIELCWGMRNARRVGELGFGTNTGVTRLVAMNSHINERVPGVHLGFGQHNQRIDRVDYLSDVHLDLIARGGTVTVDGGPDVIDLARPAADEVAHPTDVNDEDIDGDCCALSFEQCLRLGER